MKKLLLLLALLLTQIITSQIVTIPDANFKAELIRLGVDTNGDGEIQVSEAEAITSLGISNSHDIGSYEGIRSFTNLETLNLGLVMLNNVVIDLSGLSNLVTFTVGRGGQLSGVNLTGLSSLTTFECIHNSLYELDFSDSPNITSISCADNGLGTLILPESTTLTTIDVRENWLTSLNLPNLPNLDSLDCYGNRLTSLDLSPVPNLTFLDCGFNLLTSLDLSNVTNLIHLDCSYNQISTIDVSASNNLENLYIADNSLTSLDISGLPNLNKLNCSKNSLTSLNLSNLPNLTELGCSQNNLTSLNFSNLPNLSVFNCHSNALTSLDLSDFPNLTSVGCQYNQLATVNISALSNLKEFYCEGNQLSTIDFSNSSNLEALNCAQNQLTSLNLSASTNLKTLQCSQNQLTSLDVTSLSELTHLTVEHNQLTALDLTGSINLRALYLPNNNLTTLDASNSPLLRTIFVNHNESLETLFLKNGTTIDYVILHESPNIQYVCVNEGDLEAIQNTVNNYYGYTDCAVNTYCTFVPGNNPSYVTGNIQLDVDNDGCDTNDIGYGNLKLKVTNASNDSDIYSTSGDGSYNIALPNGSYTIEPVLENPSYFNVSPTSFTVNFPSDTSPFQQDLCLTSNGIIQDLEIQIIPLELARPGFDTDYKIVYKNNGNSVVSGDVNLTYDDTVMDLVSSTPNFTVSSLGNLSWSYADLAPLETREILMTMNLNTPMETPPLNGDEILCFEATITPITNDQRVNDNTFTLKQTVVNSYDPNDKTCLEGNIVTPDLIGDYVHYLIRFENTGTASAVNVVVKDVIDTDKFDISTIDIYDSSHDMVTRIQNTNEVEFIFEGIHLPFDDANNDGYIAFKIKTLPSLVVGDTFENNAEIYFDFNFPIITNIEQTTIENTASVDDIFAASDMRIFPNPANKLLTIESSVSFDSVTIYDLKGRQLQRISSTSPQLTKQIDMTHLASGIYYVSVQSGTAKKLLKVIRE